MGPDSTDGVSRSKNSPDVLYSAEGSRDTLIEMDRCHTHRHEESMGICRSCRREFCDRCLVYSFGRARAPYCVRCALIAAGTTPAESWVAEHTLSA
jgi:hypothetical protein